MGVELLWLGAEVDEQPVWGYPAHSREPVRGVLVPLVVNPALVSSLHQRLARHKAAEADLLKQLGRF